MSRLRGAAFGVAMFIATLVVLGFLVLPIVAIFARVPLHLLIDQLDDPIVPRRARAHGHGQCARARRDPALRHARRISARRRAASAAGRS